MSRFLVQQPLHILGVAGVCFLAWAMLRFGRGRNARHAVALLVPGYAWLAYAIWEWLVLVRTPEANIRVDLLIIWPLLASATVWPLFKLLFHGRSATAGSNNGDNGA